VEHVTVYARFSIKSKNYSIATVLSYTLIIRSALKEEVKKRIIRRVGLSLPDGLFGELDGLVKESGRTSGSTVVGVLKVYLGESDSHLEVKTYPTTLQKLREQGIIKLRSP
jgi:hypothetical protein